MSFQYFNEFSMGKNWDRFGNYLYERMDKCKLGLRNFWVQPCWTENAKVDVRHLLRLSEEAEGYYRSKFALLKGDLVVVQLRWGNHKPGENDHFPTPACKFVEYLDDLLPRLKNWSLYIAGCPLNKIEPYFKKYNSYTGITLPSPNPDPIGRIGDLEDVMLCDFYAMRMAKKLICSNSSFSWIASLLNDNCDLFVRPNQQDELVKFEPWKSTPCVRLNGDFCHLNVEAFRKQEENGYD